MSSITASPTHSTPDFTPFRSAVGALLLYHAASTLLYRTGSVFGLSGFLRQTTSTITSQIGGIVRRSNEHVDSAKHKDQPVLPAGTIALLGLSVSSLLFRSGSGPETRLGPLFNGTLMAISTAWASGCTSGHFIVGMGRLSVRSLVVAAVVLPSALITHYFFSSSSFNTLAALSTYSNSQVVALSAATAALSTVLPFIVASLTTQSTGIKSTYFVTGIEFGTGLLISGMADPAKVLAFFSIGPTITTGWFEQWDPSLLVVMGFAVIPGLVENFYRRLLISTSSSGSSTTSIKPSFSTHFEFPAQPELWNTRINPAVAKTAGTTTIKPGPVITTRLLVGATLFGFLWGLDGICPGPAVLVVSRDLKWFVTWLTGYGIGSSLASLV